MISLHVSPTTAMATEGNCKVNAMSWEHLQCQSHGWKFIGLAKIPRVSGSKLSQQNQQCGGGFMSEYSKDPNTKVLKLLGDFSFNPGRPSKIQGIDHHILFGMEGHDLLRGILPKSHFFCWWIHSFQCWTGGICEVHHGQSNWSGSVEGYQLDEVARDEM